MTEEKLAQIVESEECFTLAGSSYITIGKVGRTPHGFFHGVCVPAAISPEFIDGLYLDEQQNPPRLYLNWHRSAGKKEQTLIGRVDDVEQIKKLMERFNTLYAQNK